MQVWHALAEHVDVDQLCAGFLLQDAGDPGQDRPQRGCFDTVEVGDMRDVPLGLQIGEAHHGCCQTDRYPPQVILPGEDAPKFAIAVKALADEATFRQAHASRVPDHRLDQ